MAGLAEQMERDAGPAEAAKPAGDGSLASRMENDIEIIGGAKTAAAEKRSGPTKESATSPQDFTGVKIQAPDNTTTPEVIAHVSTGIGSTIAGGWHGLAKLATGGSLEDAANAVTDDQERFTYQPKGEEAQRVTKDIAGPKNPLNWIPMGAKNAAEAAVDVGAPPGLVAPIEALANIAGPAAAMKGLRLVGRGSTAEALPPLKIEPGAAIDERVAPSVLRPQASLDEITTAQQNWIRAAESPHTSIEEVNRLGAEVERMKAAQAATPATPEPAPTPAAEPTLAPAAGASRDRFTTPVERGEETPKFMEEAPEAGEAMGPEYRARVGVLRRVGVTEPRESALTGDKRTANTDFQQSRVDGPAGRHMMAGLEREKVELTNYSEGLARDTGGTLGTDSATQYDRGNKILAPLEDLNKQFNAKTRELYKIADERSAGQPLTPKNIGDVVKDKADFIGTVEGKHLLEGVTQRLRDLGIMDENGGMKPVTVKQAEQLRQYVGQQWQNRTSRLIGKIKDAIDDDVTSAPGMEDIYKTARGMRAMKASIFENDLDLGSGRSGGNGIAKLFDANGKGIDLKAGVSPENIANKIAAMPVDQFAQVVKTLKTAPGGDAALAEIKAHFASKIHETGTAQANQWAAKNVSKYLNQNAARMQQIFTPEEMAKFNDLNDAGHILAKDQSYTGAEAQKQSLLRRSGTYLVGEVPVVGKFAASKLSDAMSLMDAQKRFKRLSDLPPD